MCVLKNEQSTINQTSQNESWQLEECEMVCMIKIDLLKNHTHAIPALANIWHEVLGKIWMPEIGIEEPELRV